jgi:beta-glucosidase
MNRTNTTCLLAAGLVTLSSFDLGAGDLAVQPVVAARTKQIISVDGHQFKDLNGNGQLDPYEDWRLPVAKRIDDLLARMTVDEKAGMMLIDSVNAGCGGVLTPQSSAEIADQNMTRAILRNTVTMKPVCSGEARPGGFGGGQVSPTEMATFTNAVQELRERTRLGIPMLFKSNARNHIDPDSRFGISEAAGAFTAFPKEAGLAAAALGQEALRTGRTPANGDMLVIRDFARVMGAEWRSVGLRGMYGYMADLGTEPRWFRIQETFTENADLAANIIRTLVQTLQGVAVRDGTSVTPVSAVALTVKHFPGGGPQEDGLDPHYTFGKQQVYGSEAGFAYHLKPFRAAIDAGVSAIMPYYGVPTAGRDSNGEPVSLRYDGAVYDQTGFAFSKQIVSGLLRAKLGFQGYVNSDTGIINDRAWGLEKKSVPERVAAAVNGGVDVLSGFHDKKVILDLLQRGLLPEASLDEAVRRLLKEQFQLGLFENPYVDAAKAAGAIGNEGNRAVALDLQRKSLVLLRNAGEGSARKPLPLKPRAKIYIAGNLTKAGIEKYGFTVTDGNAAIDGVRPSATGHDYALISVTALADQKATGTYRSDDPATGLNPAYRNPLTNKPWGSQDRCVDPSGFAEGASGAKPACIDAGMRFGGVFPWEASNLSFTSMAASKSWSLQPNLATIQAIMRETGAINTILIIYFRHPYVLDKASGMLDAGAILANFGISDPALMDVLSGKVNPQGRLPYALANNLEAIAKKRPDRPGYAEADTLYEFGFGLSYGKESESR